MLLDTQITIAAGHRLARISKRPKPLDTRSNRVRTNHQQICGRGAYTARVISGHNRGLADIPLRLLTCDKCTATHSPAGSIMNKPCRFPPRHRACRSLLPDGSRLSCRSSDLRPHGHAHQGQRRLTCENAGSWTHACLAAITRFCSSAAHFRVQAPGQLRNPGHTVRTKSGQAAGIR